VKFYLGERTPEGCTVEVIDTDNPNGGYLLETRNDLRNYSSGFDFGSPGSGPAQLALALLADALGSDRKALDNYQQFKAKVLAPMEGDTFELSQEDIIQLTAGLTAGRPR
jgi:hypothetical protein